ncbi:MAG: hypothetical protein ABR964_05230 [Tepidisphaeraceae bacterium]|jgi:uncharacterized coiled-coil protein SlyX
MRISQIAAAGLLLIFTSVAWPQISPEEAQKRLEEREAARAAAATQPAADAEEVATLKSIIKDQRTEIDELKAQVAALKRQLSAASAPAANPTANPAAKPTPTAPKGKLAKGMTKEQAIKQIGQPPRSDETDANGQEVITWSIREVDMLPDAGGRTHARVYEKERIDATFQDGILSDFNDQVFTPPNWISGN